LVSNFKLTLSMNRKAYLPCLLILTFFNVCSVIDEENNQDLFLLTSLALTPNLTKNASCADVYDFNKRDEEAKKLVRQVQLEPGMRDRFRIFSPTQEVFYGYELITGPYKIFIYGLGSLDPSLQVCSRKAEPRAATQVLPESGIRYLSAEVPSAPPLPPQEIDEETGEPIPRPREDLEGTRVGETTNMRVRYTAPLNTGGGLGFYTISLHTPTFVHDNPFTGGGSCNTDFGCFQYNTDFSLARRHCEFVNAGTFTTGGTCPTASRPICSGALNEGLLSLNGSTRTKCDEVFGARDAYFWDE
jgi:hypothetical protein